MSARPVRRPPFEIAGVTVPAGRRGIAELPIARWAIGSPMSLGVLVCHGRFDGPVIWLSAAIHGDELNGIEIIRQVMNRLEPRLLRGTVLAVPVVNAPGFMTGDRYLPDRRDLNRSFPGSTRGSLAGRIAHLFLDEVVDRCSAGIDFHTGSGGRYNLPQVRADLDDSTTRSLAVAFGAPATLHARERAGSLRQAASRRGATVLLYEGGEALRFTPDPIRHGIDGTFRALAHLDMIDTDQATPAPPTQLYRSSSWIRSRRGGVCHLDVEIGDPILRGDTVARIHDAFGRRLSRISAPKNGLVIGLNLTPIIHQGDAIAHIAAADDATSAADDATPPADDDAEFITADDDDPPITPSDPNVETT